MEDPSPMDEDPPTSGDGGEGSSEGVDLPRTLQQPPNTAASTTTEGTNIPTTTATIPRIITSRLDAVWDDFHARMSRIEALERKLDARAIQTRRRLTNLLESHAGVWNGQHRSSSQSQSSQRDRASHVRLFVTHRVVNSNTSNTKEAGGAEGGGDGALSTTSADPATAPTTTLGYLDPDPRHVVPHYLLHIEGRLLVGHLDHASAASHDATTNYTVPDDDLDRSRAEPEEAPDAVVPIHCTHLFAKLVVHLEPLYQPKPHPMSKKFLQQQQQQSRPMPPASVPAPTAPPAPQPTKKSARRGSTKSPTAPSSAVATSAVGTPDAEEEPIDPSRLVRGDTTTLTWTPDLSPDAHLWEVSYTPPNPPGHHLMPHSVVATIHLHPRRADELYEPIHPVATEKLFPHHRAAPDESIIAPATAPTAASSSSNKSSKKRKADTDLVASRTATPTPPTEGSSAVDEPAPTSSKSGPVSPPATDPSIHIPQGLTMGEIVQALYVYICDKQLQDPTSPSTIVCDDTLRSMFHVDRFPFDQVRQLLVRHNLFAAISHQPVELVYILKPETAVPTPPSSNAAVMADLPPMPPDWHAALLQLDMDASVPDYFPFRCRELLRRIKRRELEYTSSRTKARYLLASRKAKAEEPLKHWLDAAIGGRAVSPHAALQPVLLALAKATPPKTEARNSAHLDARLSLLLERVKERQDAAATEWRLVEACRRGGRTNESGAPSDDHDRGNDGN